MKLNYKKALKIKQDFQHLVGQKVKTKEGENEISVKVTGSLKNTFGFFYQKNDNWIYGPHSWNFSPKKIPAASEYYLMDYGMFEPFELVAVN